RRELRRGRRGDGDRLLQRGARRARPPPRGGLRLGGQGDRGRLERRGGVATEHVVQRGDDGEGVARAVVGTGREEAQHERVEVGREPGDPLTGRDRRGRQRLEQLVRLGARVVRQKAGDRLVEKDAERVEVGAAVGGEPLDVLRRDVPRRAEDLL